MLVMLETLTTFRQTKIFLSVFEFREKQFCFLGKKFVSTKVRREAGSGH